MYDYSEETILFVSTRLQKYLKDNEISILSEKIKDISIKILDITYSKGGYASEEIIDAVIPAYVSTVKELGEI